MFRSAYLPLLAVLTACSAKSPSSSESRTTANDPRSTVVAPSVDKLPPPDPREAALSAVVLQLLEHEHLLRKHIDDDVSNAAFETYLDRLDGAKMFLLKSDRDALQPYADKIDDELRSGKLDLAHEGSKVFSARVAVVDKIVADLLAQPMNHDDEEFVELDSKKVEPAVTEDELKDRWRRRLELEVLERAAGMEARLEPEEGQTEDAERQRPTRPRWSTTTMTASIAAARQDPDDARGPRGQGARPISRRATRRGSRGSPPRAARRGLRAGQRGRVDARSAHDYLPPADKANFDIPMTGSLEGIGAVLREHDDYIEVVEIVPGGARWRQGELDRRRPDPVGRSRGQGSGRCRDMHIDDVVKMIRGPKGTVVTLRVQKPDGARGDDRDHARRDRDRGGVRARRACSTRKGSRRSATSTCPASTATRAARAPHRRDVATAALGE